jgi:hypothetical protein
MNFQSIIAIILVAFSVFYIGRRMYRNTRHDGTKEGCAKCDEIKSNKKALR